jgi:inosine/xanthosine triphosphatase
LAIAIFLAPMNSPQIRTVAVGSKNRVKIASVEAVLARAGWTATVSGIEVPSGVAAQPMGEDETIRGATARAIAAQRALDADLGVGIEGGCIDNEHGMSTCAYVVVVDRAHRTSIGGSLQMPLPPRVAALVRQGVELGHAIDRISGELDTKQGAGAVGFLTAGLVDRQRAYEPLVAYALSPMLAPDWWA